MIALLLAVACSDYALSPKADDPDPGGTFPDPGPHPSIDLVRGNPPRPSVVLEPAEHDFGELALGETTELPLTLSNVGDADLHVSALAYTSSSGELVFDPEESTNGPLPWTLGPGESRPLSVDFVPTDIDLDDGELAVVSDDPFKGTVTASQIGTARPFPGFSTGWYIYEDPTVQDTWSNPAYLVDRVGDPDGYWYEGSGVHGMRDSADPTRDFAVLHDWVIARAGAPTPVTGPLSFHGASTLTPLTAATFSYILCDFWMERGDDPALWSITSGTVDDGIEVIVNGHILGELEYMQSGSWPLTDAVPGAVNTLVVIVEDNAEVEKFVNDLAFWRDGVMVGS
jgi:hypothetical protein